MDFKLDAQLVRTLQIYCEFYSPKDLRVMLQLNLFNGPKYTALIPRYGRLDVGFECALEKRMVNLLQCSSWYALSYKSFIRHARPQIAVPILRIIQTVFIDLHILAALATQAFNRDVNQASPT